MRSMVVLGLIISGFFSLFADNGFAVRPKSQGHLVELPGVAAKTGSPHALWQGEDGLLWIGSDRGLFLYDGFRLQTIGILPNPKSTTLQQPVRAISSDGDSHLWVATPRQLIRVHRKSLAHREVPWKASRSGQIMTVRSIAYQRGQGLWVATDTMVFLINEEGTKVGFERTLPPSDAIIQAVVPMPDKLWIATRQHGLWFVELESKKLHSLTFKARNPLLQSISSAVAGRSGVVWCSAGGRYFGVESATEQLLEAPRPLWHPSKKNILTPTQGLAEDRQQFLWLWGDDTLLRVNPRSHSVTPFSYPGQSHSAQGFQTIFVAKDETVWLGGEAGLFWWHPRLAHLRVLTGPANRSEPFPHPRARAFLEDRHHYLWIGTDTGLNRLDPYTHIVEHIGQDPAAQQLRIRSLAETANGLLWLGTDRQGLWSYNRDQARFKRFPLEPKDTSHYRPKILCFETDGSDRLWVGTDRGLFVVETSTGTSQHFSVLNHASEELQVRDIVQDQQQNLWIASQLGLWIKEFSRNTLIRFVPPSEQEGSLWSRPLNSLVLQGSQWVWGGFAGGDIRSFWRRTDGGMVVGEPSITLPQAVYSLSLESDEALWIGTGEGIYRYDIRRQRHQRVTRHDGLPSDRFPLGASHYARNGTLYVGVAEGLAALDSNFIHLPSRQMEPVLRSVRIMAPERIQPDPELPVWLTAKPGEKKLEINLKPASFTATLGVRQIQRAGNVRFHYRLVGRDDHWSRLSQGTNQVSFHGLQNGEYRLQFAVDDQLEASETLIVKVAIPWYRNGPIGMVLLGLLCLGALVVLGWRFLKRPQLTLSPAASEVETNQIKDYFLANVSHELKTPLHGIIGMTESVLEGAAGTLSRKMVHDLNLIAGSSRRLAQLVDDLLDFSRLKRHGIQLFCEPVNLAMCAQRVIEMAVYALEEKSASLTLKNQVPDDIMVFADENRLIQILQNLVDNAIKYSFDGEIIVGASAWQEMIRIWVSDQGIGIAPSQKERIFGSFIQGEGHTVRRHEGVGLGLAIVRQLVEQHRGTIWVESQLHRGTTFSFTLPFVKPEHLPKTIPTREWISQTEVNQDRDRISKPRQIKILIVDDDPLHRQVIKNILDAEEYAIYQAAQGAKALHILDKYPDIDIVLLDTMMQDLSGYEICVKIRERFAIEELPILLFTRNTDHEDIMRAFGSGANDYLVKPLKNTELKARLHIHLSLLHAHRELETLVSERTRELNLANEQLRQANRALECTSVTDPLTGLGNRRFFTKMIQSDVERAIRCHHPSVTEATRRTAAIGLFLVDIDHFKRVNDTYGHDVGDEVLIQVAVRLQELGRKEDAVIRWGGEEFLVVRRSFDPHHAANSAEQICLAMADHSFDCGSVEIQCTVSVGFCCFPLFEHHPDLAPWQQLIKFADLALYAAKRAGRNGWVGFETIHLDRSAERPPKLVTNDLNQAVANDWIRPVSSFPLETVILTGE